MFKCDFKSGSKTILMNHQKAIHMECNNPCNKCEYKANTKENLHKHIAECHEESEIKCNQCDHKAITKQDLNKHIDLTHIDNNINNNENDNDDEKIPSKNRRSQKYISKRIKCQKCDKKFNKKETYQKHVNKIHGGMNTSQTQN